MPLFLGILISVLLTPARAKDVDGKEYLDFICMFNAVNQGHSHPTIIEAVMKQMQEDMVP